MAYETHDSSTMKYTYSSINDLVHSDQMRKRILWDACDKINYLVNDTNFTSFASPAGVEIFVLEQISLTRYHESQSAVTFSWRHWDHAKVLSKISASVSTFSKTQDMDTKCQ